MNTWIHEWIQATQAAILLERSPPCLDIGYLVISLQSTWSFIQPSGQAQDSASCKFSRSSSPYHVPRTIEEAGIWRQTGCKQMCEHIGQIIVHQHCFLSGASRLKLSLLKHSRKKEKIINLGRKKKELATLTHPYPGPAGSSLWDFTPFSTKFLSSPSSSC